MSQLAFDECTTGTRIVWRGQAGVITGSNPASEGGFVQFTLDNQSASYRLYRSQIEGAEPLYREERKLQHPLPIGTQIRSLHGEQDEDEKGNVRIAPPGSVGKVVSRDHYANGQGWTYGILFPNDCWVFIDQGDSIDDPAK